MFPTERQCNWSGFCILFAYITIFHIKHGNSPAESKVGEKTALQVPSDDGERTVKAPQITIALTKHSVQSES